MTSSDKLQEIKLAADAMVSLVAGLKGEPSTPGEPDVAHTRAGYACISMLINEPLKDFQKKVPNIHLAPGLNPMCRTNPCMELDTKLSAGDCAIEEKSGQYFFRVRRDGAYWLSWQLTVSSDDSIRDRVKFQAGICIDDSKSLKLRSGFCGNAEHSTYYLSCDTGGRIVSNSGPIELKNGQTLRLAIQYKPDRSSDRHEIGQRGFHMAIHRI